MGGGEGGKGWALIESAGRAVGCRLRRAPLPGMEAWGNTGQNKGGGALPLMRSIKKHFDARGILNPGVFVGGI